LLKKLTKEWEKNSTTKFFRTSKETVERRNSMVCTELKNGARLRMADVALKYRKYTNSHNQTIISILIMLILYF
jgi:hypothetical protein